MISVVVCVKNEQMRIEGCLDTIYENNPSEVILVDGNSSDATVDLARKYPGIRIIQSQNSSLPKDRQIGIDAAQFPLIAMIDADHRLQVGDLSALIKDMEKYDFDIVQSGLIAYRATNFWDCAESEAWEVTQNMPGKRVMIGVAPALYKKHVFDYVRFDDHITKTIEDTDFSYRLSKVPGIHMGVGDTIIQQYHYATFSEFMKKFKWYGKGDGEFCFKHPERARSMIFHLLIRYPILHSLKALRMHKFRSIPFFIIQGNVRFYSASICYLKLLLGRSSPANLTGE